MLYSATLYRVCKGSKYTLVIILIILLIISNFGAIGYSYLSFGTFVNNK